MIQATDSQGFSRKYHIIVFLLTFFCCQSSYAQGINPDLPELLYRVSQICGDRWNIDIGDGDQLHITSRDQAFGEAAGYSFGPGDQQYILRFRFNMVEPLSTQERVDRRLKLHQLREEAAPIPHDEIKGYYHYSPRTPKEWKTVLEVKSAEKQVDDIPNLRFKSVCLSTEYSMKFFIPNRNNIKALQYMADIDNIYNLFEELPVGPIYDYSRNPVPTNSKPVPAPDIHVPSYHLNKPNR